MLQQLQKLSPRGVLKKYVFCKKLFCSVAILQWRLKKLKKKPVEKVSFVEVTFTAGKIQPVELSQVFLQVFNHKCRNVEKGVGKEHSTI